MSVGTPLLHSEDNDNMVETTYKMSVGTPRIGNFPAVSVG